MSVIRNMVRKSGGSMSKCVEQKAVFGAFASLVVLQGCAIGNPLNNLPPMDMPYESMKISDFSSIDRRVWRINRAKGVSGFAVADEPQAVKVAQYVLENGGNAADAATALYFALTVTYPGAASLGGGGSCLVSDPSRTGVHQINFPVRQAKNGGAIAVPGNVRGFAHLSIRHGRKSWSDLVGPAARLAGKGAVMSRATQSQLLAAKHVAVLPEAMMYGGKAISVGREYKQAHLAATLGLIQGSGAGMFYNGDLSDTIVKDASKLGGTLSHADMREYRAEGSPAIKLSVRNMNIFTRNGSDPENALWQDVATEGLSASPDASSARMSDAGATSFIVADKEGMAVACSVSMNGVFGSGKVSPTSGVYFANSQDETSLASLVLVKHKGLGVVYGSASGGGRAGFLKSAATTESVVLEKNQSLAQALRQNQGSGFDAVNAFHCSEGLDDGMTSCRFGTEPEGYGYGLIAR
jgi:gamma-glutamyltranspeptidase / glutathione hydrolase